MDPIKLISIILCTLFLALTFTSCYSNVDPAYIDADDCEPLMLYIYDWDEATKRHISAYNALHDETQIEYESFDINSFKAMHNRIKKEITEHRGPDLILEQ